MKRMLVVLLLVALVFPVYAETEDDFKLELSGDSTSIVTNVTIPSGNIRVSFKQERKGKYEVSLMSGTSTTEILSGYRYANADVTRKTGVFDVLVEAESPWTLVFESLGMELFFEGLEGSGSYVSDMFVFTKPIIVEISCSVKEFDGFIVSFYSLKDMRWDYDLLVNELIEDEGSVSYKKILKVSTGQLGFFTVDADGGEWSITIVE